MSVQRKSSHWVVLTKRSEFAKGSLVLLAVVALALRPPVVPKTLFDDEEDEKSMRVGVAGACFGLPTQSDSHMPVASGFMFNLCMSAVGGRWVVLFEGLAVLLVVGERAMPES